MQNRSLETRKRIIETSFQLFIDQGYETTGVAQICDQANVSKGSFYHHFPSKYSLFLSVLDNWLSDLDSQFKSIENNSLPIPEQMKMMSLSLNSIFSRPDQIPIFVEFWIQAMRDPIISHKLLEPYFKYLKYFKSLFTKAMTEGSINTSCQANYSSRVIVAFSLGLILECMIEPHSKNWTEISQYGVEKFLFGHI